MPIKLDDIQTPLAVKTYSPFFFSKELTGQGGKTGLLCSMRDPVQTGSKVTTPHDAIDPVKRRFHNGPTTVHCIPMGVLTSDAWSIVKQVPTPGDLGRKFADTSSGNGAFHLWMEPQATTLEVTINGSGAGRSTERKLTVVWRIRVIHTTGTAPNRILHASNDDLLSLVRSSRDSFCNIFSANPPKAVSEVCSFLEHEGMLVDRAAVDDWLASISLYESVCERVRAWHEDADEELRWLLSSLDTSAASKELPVFQMAVLGDVCSRLESYRMPLGLYRSIYADLARKLCDVDLKRACKANLNLLLSDTLVKLDADHDSLERVLPQGQPAPTIDPFYSREQAVAIASDSPLTLIQSGAGTGKSTLIKGRLDYMAACGIDMSDVMVLSFTNAAADHILDIAPQVHSMTIAKMIHTIYSANHPGHELSTEDTLANSLDIYFPDDQFAHNFQLRLRDVMKENDQRALTRLNSFVENHFDDVMTALDVVGQTTLNLEIIICYQAIDSMSEPPEVASRHLIVDEVQDNSIFEFIYLLRYVAKHKESLLIIGDCSQTLYEFRSSNPRALNVMEGSGVFATYKLQVNYRSNQDILDFANILLSDIEANQYANIRLQANSLAKVTSKSFEERVQLQHHPLSRLSELDEILTNTFHDGIAPFLAAKRAAGEKVCFLSHQRKYASLFQKLCETEFPDASCVSLVPERTFNSTVFSNFIRKFWNEVQFMPGKSVTLAIQTEIIGRLDELMPPGRATKALPSVQNMLMQWVSESRTRIRTWQHQADTGQIPRQEFVDKVRQDMLDYEIRTNAIKQSITSSRNAQAKADSDVDNADFLFSTIHSAKGLEFDNTVVLYRAENRMDEQDKRMYYVALTRAMRSELIISYSSLKNPDILVQHEAVLEDLRQQEALAATAPTAAS